MHKQERFLLLAWSLSITVSLLAIGVWGQGLDWELASLSSYTLFPLFGLLAFSLMWSHYIVAAGREWHGLDRKVTARYFDLTSLAVLTFICVHPGLLIWQLWRDGVGLPPGSVYTYVGPSLKLATTVGVVSLLVFLSYEFRRWFKDRSWWRFVQYASDVAMLAIVYHSLSLGSNLQTGWFRYVWIFYALSLVSALVYIYVKKLTKQKTAS